MIRFVDLGNDEPLIDRALSDIREIAMAGSFTLGPAVEEFERRFAAFCETGRAVACASGTDALVLLLKAIEIGPGDEVIVPANTFIATAEAVAACGAAPRPADVLEHTFNIDPEAVEAAVGPRTKAIIAVHLYGQPADMDALAKVAVRHNLALLEDACQAHGAGYKGRRAGGLAAGAAFSFYPSKNLGGWGDGGMVVTNSEELAEKLKMLRNHGEKTKHNHIVPGLCSRLDSIQAAILSLKIESLPERNESRRQCAALYDARLNDRFVAKPRARADCEHVYHLYVARVRERDELRRYLTAAGIETGIHYPVPIHLQPAWSRLGFTGGDFPVAEKLAGEIISLPMHARLTEEQINCVGEKIDDFYALRSARTGADMTPEAAWD